MGVADERRGDGALLFGRWTYDKMQSAWTQQPEDNPIRQVLENSTKYVASRSDDPVEWRTRSCCRATRSRPSAS